MFDNLKFKTGFSSIFREWLDFLLPSGTKKAEQVLKIGKIIGDFIYYIYIKGLQLNFPGKYTASKVCFRVSKNIIRPTEKCGFDRVNIS